MAFYLLLRRCWIRTTFLPWLITSGACITVVIGVRAAFVATLRAYDKATITKSHWAAGSAPAVWSVESITLCKDFLSVDCYAGVTDDFDCIAQLASRRYRFNHIVGVTGMVNHSELILGMVR
ncbi:hypothetical protein [Enterobacter kobei]|uniref:hypothetical protein n=1 Tax=Enterobacter kobei TaxID=208224 RepID=UPI002448DA94|nr:hypothetical protein [Enterobacter kobei]MDH0279015.1 hypothetical protein [Enterobacter kobei]MDH1371580.1 hypothetical protein [Enterobacter kobei]MDH1989890.1 hypothetical protein [Enterobacter kobei]MDH2008482.1 hypothetical protein [Enterobacter kobei]